MQSSKSPIVLFDLDDVIAIMRDETSRAFSKMSGKHVPYEHWHTLCSEVLYGVRFCPETLMRERILENCAVEGDAVSVFEELHSAGLKTAIITARGWHRNGVKITETWLDERGISPTELHVVDLGEHSTKAEAFSGISKLHDIRGFIDDQPRYLEQAQARRDIPNIVVRNHPWNYQYDADLKRVDSLTEFKDIILSQA